MSSILELRKPIVVFALLIAATSYARADSLSPARIAIDGAGTRYVSDPSARAVVVFDAAGNRVRSIAIEGRPAGVAISAATDTLYVGNLDAQSVEVWGAQDGVRRGALGVGRGEVAKPLAIAVSASGGVFVADGKARRVKVYGQSGQRIGAFDVDGFPVSVAVFGGEVFVGDGLGGRVFVFGEAGALRRSIGTLGNGAGMLTRVGGVAVARDGTLYVVDTFQSRVAIFDRAGMFLAFVGAFGAGPEELRVPIDAALDGEAKLVVTDSDNGRLQVFEVAGRIPTPTPTPAPAAASVPAPAPAIATATATAPAAAPALPDTWFPEPEKIAAPPPRRARTSGCSVATGTEGISGALLLILVGAFAWRRRVSEFLVIAALSLVGGRAFALDPPHDNATLGDACRSCHIVHQSAGVGLMSVAGNANLCMSCHTSTGVASDFPFATIDQAVPGDAGSSHRWDAPAVNAARGAGLPSSPAMLRRIDDGGMTCSACHDQHRQTLDPFDLGAPETPGADGRHLLRRSNEAAALCVECHAARATDAGVRTYTGAPFTHPVGKSLTGAAGFHAVPRDIDGGAQVDALFGVATGGSTASLVDAIKNFTGTVGLRVRITSGANRGAVRAIVAVPSATQVNLSPALATAVGAGVTYEIDRDGNTTNDLLLWSGAEASATSGQVVCMTCHGVHFTDSNSATYDDAPRAGDGMLLRRTRASDDTCAACHAVKTHSAATGTGKYGTWGAANSCATCHQAHGTRNIFLVGESVKDESGAAKPVSLRAATGLGDGGLVDPASLATSVCAACHTRTTHFRADGTGSDQNHASLGALSGDMNCLSCHRHADGFKPRCSGCHMPTPTNQDYAGGGGAHVKHVTELGFVCSACHAGATHDQGDGGAIVAANVQVGFASATFPRGTTASNGGVPVESHNGGAPTCQVGCHNPVLGDPGDPAPEAAPNLNNIAHWTSGTLRCTDCHDSQRRAVTVNTDAGAVDAGVSVASVHPILTTDVASERRDCERCHDQSQHTKGVTRAKAFDGGAVVVTGADAGATDAVCKGCHMTAGATLGGRAPTNVAGFDNPGGDYHGVRAGAGWGGTLKPPYARGQGPLACATCHAQHGSKNAFLLRSVVNGRTVTTPIARSGVGAEQFCQGCHEGAYHAGCMGCHGVDPVSPPTSCFYCHTHNGIERWPYPDDSMTTTCDHCHSSWYPQGLANDRTAPTITVGPNVVPTSTGATITWTTNEASTSRVEYGTECCGATAGNANYVTSHTVTLTGLAMGTSYAYRVVSRDQAENRVVSPILTFATNASDPPPTPTLVGEPDVVSTTTTVATLAWNPVTDPNGDGVEYFVEVSTSPSFSTTYASAGWQTATSAGFTLATGQTYYWRVKARDAAHPSFASGWSVADTFAVMRRAAPPVPVLFDQPDYNSGGAGSQNFTLVWNAVTYAPDPVEYLVQVSTASNFAQITTSSGWLSTTSWTVPLSTGGTSYWRVMARNKNYTEAQSAWSASDSFSDQFVSSCPFVYVWDGAEFTYETDIQGQVLGLPPASSGAKYAGLYGPSYVVLDRLRPNAAGDYVIKVREALAEIDYFDEAKLLVVDHGVDDRIVSSNAENTYTFGYANPFQIHTVRKQQTASPISARDQNGVDVLASLKACDGVPAPADKDALVAYTLDFGSVANPARARLVIDGWSVYGAGYRGGAVVAPFIEVQDASGAWVRAKSLGAPAGDLKTMVIDLAGVLQGNAPVMRVNLGRRSGARWAIDCVRLDDSAPAPVAVTEVPLAAANLHHPGAVTHSNATLEHRIAALDDAKPDVPGHGGTGSFTRFGDVRELLVSAENKFVVMSHGDEVTLTFRAPPAGAPGTRRTVILKADVYYKAPDRAVEPFPFRGMSAYPYPATEVTPFDADHALYRATYNTRVLPAP
jgi:predicted CXXCH cytochrome family protein